MKKHKRKILEKNNEYSADFARYKCAVDAIVSMYMGTFPQPTTSPPTFEKVSQRLGKEDG